MLARDAPGGVDIEVEVPKTVERERVVVHSGDDDSTGRARGLGEYIADGVPARKVAWIDRDLGVVESQRLVDQIAVGVDADGRRGVLARDAPSGVDIELEVPKTVERERVVHNGYDGYISRARGLGEYLADGVPARKVAWIDRDLGVAEPERLVDRIAIGVNGDRHGRVLTRHATELVDADADGPNAIECNVVCTLVQIDCRGPRHVSFACVVLPKIVPRIDVDRESGQQAAALQRLNMKAAGILKASERPPRPITPCTTIGLLADEIAEDHCCSLLVIGFQENGAFVSLAELMRVEAQ